MITIFLVPNPARFAQKWIAKDVWSLSNQLSEGVCLVPSTCLVYTSNNSYYSPTGIPPQSFGVKVATVKPL